MTPWHIEYLKPEEFEKWHVQEGLSDHLLKQVIKPLVRGSLPISEGKEHSYLQRTRYREEYEPTGLAKFPPVRYTYLILFGPSPLSMTLHSSSNLP